MASVKSFNSEYVDARSWAAHGGIDEQRLWSPQPDLLRVAYSQSPCASTAEWVSE